MSCQGRGCLVMHHLMGPAWPSPEAFLLFPFSPSLPFHLRNHGLQHLPCSLALSFYLRCLCYSSLAGCLLSFLCRSIFLFFVVIFFCCQPHACYPFTKLFMLFCLLSSSCLVHFYIPSTFRLCLSPALSLVQIQIQMCGINFTSHC